MLTLYDSASLLLSVRPCGSMFRWSLGAHLSTYVVSYLGRPHYGASASSFSLPLYASKVKPLLCYQPLQLEGLNTA